MTLSNSALATEMENMVPTSDPGDAATALATAYGEYMKDAVADGTIPILTPSIPACVTAMANAMTFLNDDSEAGGAAKFVNGFSAFWGIMVATPAAYWTSATLIVPPPFSGLASTLASSFSSNVSGGKSLEDSVAALASDIHASTLITPKVTIGVALNIT